MADFDYGNARLRAMKSRLLSHQELEVLAEVGSVRGLIAALTKTAYRKPVEAALARTSGLECISSALKDDLVNTLGRIQRFYDGSAHEMVMIVLRTYDIHNLKTILRGLSSRAKPAEILAALLPVGDLDINLLAELARLPDPRTAIDFLATINSPYAEPLLRLRGHQPGADTNRMELALEQWRFWHAKTYLESEHLTGDLLSSALDLDVDIANLLTILRFAHAPVERRLLREWLGEDDLQALLLGPGSLSLDALVQAGMQDSLEGAIDVFSGTVYQDSLRAGEVAALSLEDLNWREMTLHLSHTKQRRERLLPLPDRVARALVKYLQHGRPPTQCRALFVRHRPPVGQAMELTHVRGAMRRAFIRCGLGPSGTHILRHTWATWAHRRGASLKLVADVLGHKSLNTTTRYAHLNLEELRQAALPWPKSRRR